MKQYTITEELRDKIQSIHFELDATKDLINYLWSQPTPNMEAIEYYSKQVRELYIEFEVAKNTLVQLYDIGATTEWDLDYNTCILTVNED